MVEFVFPAPTPEEINRARRRLQNDTSLRLTLWRELSKFLSADYDFAEALKSIQQVISRFGTRRPALAIAIAAWLPQLENGLKPNQVLGPWLSHREKLLFSIGDENNRLQASVHTLHGLEARVAGVAQTIRIQIGQSLFTLALMWFVMIGNAAYMLWKLPKESAANANSALSSSLAQLRHINELLLYTVSWSVPIILVILMFLCSMALKHLDGPIRAWADENLFLFRLYLAQTESYFFACLSFLVNAGNDEKQSLISIRTFAPSYLRQHIEHIQPLASKMRLGAACYKAARTLPTPEAKTRLLVADRTTDYKAELPMISRYADENLDVLLAGLTTRISIFVEFLNFATTLLVLVPSMSMTVA